MRVQYDRRHVVDLVGNTPLVRLNRVDRRASRPPSWPRSSTSTPAAAVKDRIALRMVEAAEESGALQARRHDRRADLRQHRCRPRHRRPAASGYKCVFVCPDKVSEDKLNVLQAYGAEVVVCPTAVAPEHPDSYYNVSDRLVREIDGRLEARPVLQPGQPAVALRDHRPRAVGADRRQGSPTSWPASAPAARSPAPAATSRRSSDGRVQIIGADPEGSVYSGGTGRPYLVEGVGEDFWPTAYDRDDRRRDRRGVRRGLFEMTRRLAREEGLLVGGSCGMAVVAALRVAERLGPRTTSSSCCCPTAGAATCPRSSTTSGWPPTASCDADAGRRDRRRRAARARTGDAAGPGAHAPGRDGRATRSTILREYGVSQMPVVRAEPPVMAAEVAGRSSSATCSTRCSPAGRRWPTRWRSTCPPAAASAPASPWSRVEAVTTTRCWWSTTASRSACSPGRPARLPRRLTWLRRRLSSDADRARDAGAIHAAVAVGVLRQILLVIVLGVVELGSRRDLRSDQPISRVGENPLIGVARRFGGSTLCLAGIVDGRSVLRATSLPCRMPCVGSWLSQKTFSKSSSRLARGSKTTSTTSVWPVAPVHTSRTSDSESVPRHSRPPSRRRRAPSRTCVPRPRSIPGRRGRSRSRSAPAPRSGVPSTVWVPARAKGRLPRPGSACSGEIRRDFAARSKRNT